MLPGLSLSVLFSVGAGAALGGMARVTLASLLNHSSSLLLMGTLAANWLGGLAMGIVLVLLPKTSLWWAFLATGFLGGLTTFSTFSAESLSWLMTQEYGHFVLHAILHILGSLMMCALGVWMARALVGAS